ncbi:SEC23-interacting protein-like isoform X2 [Frieseomelitta varia]|uniref:SEC23-interacting protein-like isoform X2 n=1 Tax=Frieseomelitta varia TaxID=561572 RepID=UPI001CB6A66A|nr:SEC23-interacting protein-like isoform X2 [Frieseomelitta varia]
MSGASRKVKNPLLSAAGEGFPFENYTENAFLVPVTPATPFSDDAELNNFVGQEPANLHNSATSAIVADADSEFTPISLHPEETKNQPTSQLTSQSTSQTTKQGYLTSILSSLPNLSLSSITSDTSGSQANQTIENVIGVQNTDPHVPLHDHRDSLRDTAPPVVANFHDPRRTNFTGLGVEVNAGSLSAPPQPTIPSSTNGPVSYRLGNQRRLKYAPPPDLTSNTSKQYSALVAQPLVTSQISATPSIFNPNEPVSSLPSYQPVETNSISTNSPSLQRSTPEYLSQANSLQESFRSSPVAVGVPYSSTGTSRSVTPQNQNSSSETVPVIEKPSIPLSTARAIPLQVPEPITPQNTPANVSYFGFDAYAGRDFPSRTIDLEKEPVLAKSHTDSPLPILRDSSTVKPVAEAKTSVTFAPVSAVQVSEKLEHLLAEQKENSSDQPTETKIEESVALCQTSERFDDVILTNTEEKNNSPQSDVFGLKEETSEAVQPTISPQEVHTDHEKLNLPQSHGVSSNVQPSQQYYQPQPFTSSVNFFTEKPPEQTLNFSLVPATVDSVSSTFSNSSTTFAQSASSYFPGPASTGSSYNNLQYKENSTNYPVDVARSRNDSQQVSFDSSTGSNFPSNSPSISVAQSSWSGNQISQTVIATCNAPDQPLQQPLFYNIAQFQDDPPKHAPASYLYTPLVKNTPTNHAQYYFDNIAESRQPYNNITSGIGVEFSATSSATTIVPEPTGSATLNPVQMSVNPLGGRTTTDSVPPSFQNLAAGTTDKRMQYREVYHHWFYRKKVEHKVLWLPFSMQDSLRLEEVHNSSEITPETTVATDGGRYDVDILRRQRSPVYWTGESAEVRRCSWFFKGPTESKYVPYDESTAAKLEEEYKQACLSNNWNRKIDLSNGEYIVFHSATVQVHYLTAVSPELTASWGNSAGAGSRPRVIKRGLDEFHIEDGEPETVDHVLFLVHGIGSVCDLKFRTVEEVVDEFRNISLQLVQSHYRTASEQRIVNRIEVLPISWHTTLHSEDTGIDKKLQAITLDSIPKLRHFTNDTLLDILFYTSPVYCQTIMETVGNELNRLYALFKKRNPDFSGGIYLGGHSLGSLILFDLLCHQKPLSDETTCENNSGTNEEQNEEDVNPCESSNQTSKRRLSKKISYVVGAAGTGQPYIRYTQLHFHPCAFFAFGSPVGMFVTVRGIDMLGEDFVLPTCPAFFNIFHPFDPVAYRVEALINPEAPKYRPMLIPHHKGRKRMHLELKETMARVGADLKQRLLDSVRNTWNSVYQLAVFHKSDNSTLEREIDKVMEEQLQQTVSDHQTNDDGGAEFKVGKLNGGRRIDYVLQEAPFEYINEYIFALTSHVCYWESEDTMLMILKEIYGSTGVQADAQLPQQTLCVERIPPSPSLSSSSKNDGVYGMDPTAPISERSIGPPPKSGFVKKS